ncbi:MAG: hypothetical protein M3Y72_13915 [Acidobacteriota bacterium]|nr:hypothetical protein [Acidobacteriota bacterium]
MRSNSRSFLVEGTTGKHYVAKLAGGLNGNRLLVNELLSARLLQHIGVATPRVCLLEVPEACSQRALSVSEQGEAFHPEPGLLLGSECPVDPTVTAIFDFLPRWLYERGRVRNPTDLAAVFAFDRWVSYTGLRAKFFVRNANDSDRRLQMYTIGGAAAFGGRTWQFADDGLGLVWRTHLYGLLDMKYLCEDAIARIGILTEQDIHEHCDHVPDDWLTEGDRHILLTEVVGTLLRRGSQLPSIVWRDLATIASEAA